MKELSVQFHSGRFTPAKEQVGWLTQPVGTWRATARNLTQVVQPVAVTLQTELSQVTVGCYEPKLHLVSFQYKLSIQI